MLKMLIMLERPAMMTENQKFVCQVIVHILQFPLHMCVSVTLQRCVAICTYVKLCVSVRPYHQQVYDHCYYIVTGALY